ncbi:MAG: penicillin-binding protein activator [Patescibacteria group bacterium]|nr:penicillin-binding protein activator [Patescibacteria group bacterium]
MSKTLQTILGIVALVILTGAIWYGFSRKPAEEGVIKIGAIIPLTGPFADWGQSIKDGLELALSDTKHKFVVDFQDDACNPVNAVSIINKFSDVDGINLVIGPGCIECLKAIAPITDQKTMLLFSTGLLDDEVFEKHQSVLNLASQISTEGKYVAKYFSMQQNIKKVAIVHGTTAFGVEHAKRLPEFLKEYNIEVTSIQSSVLNTTDFRTIILKIMQTNPDVIFIHQAEAQIGIFIKQLRELGYKIPVYSYYAVESESVLAAGREALEGMRYTYPVNSAEGSVEKQNFEKRYAQAYKNRIPTATSFFVYDGMMLLDKAMDKCQPSDIKCVKKFFTELGEYRGLSGDMRFEKDGSITRPFGIKKIEDGKFIWVTKEIEL